MLDQSVMQLRADLMQLAESLLREPGQLSLDRVAEVLGAVRITPDEIDALLGWLEEQGRPVADPIGRSASELLGEVLAVARQLRVEQGRPPRPAEIAERGGLSLEAVQRALWFARILQR